MAAVTSSRVDREHLEVEGGEGEGVAADAAAEVGDAAEPGAAEAAGVQGGDLEARGLLEPGVGEEHAAAKSPNFRRPSPAAGTG